MAIIRAYTTIMQSRKLAEILPLESADMFWMKETKDYYEAVNVPYIESTAEEDDGLPCWSLAALLEILPAGTRLLKSTNISSIGDTKYHCDCPKGNIDVWYDNPIDCCVAMINRLHEQMIYDFNNKITPADSKIIDLDELVIELEETIGTSPHSRETIKDFFQRAVQKYMNCLRIANGEIGRLVDENYLLKEKQGEQKSATQEDKELLLRDLSARLPYNLKVCYKEHEYGTESIWNVDYIIPEDFVIVTKLPYGKLSIKDTKPYLRSMSSMTEEEEIEFNSLIENTSSYFERALKELDWLNARYFDYRGLIEKGLALEAPEVMYKHFGDMDVVVTSVEHKDKL